MRLPLTHSNIKMPKYAEIQAEISKLQKQAETARQAEMSSAIEQIRTIMRDYQITEKDLKLNGKSNGKAKAGKASSTAKYRDDAGNEWGGRGRPPQWLHGKNKADFLVK